MKRILLTSFILFVGCQSSKPTKETTGTPGAPRAVVSQLPPLRIQVPSEKPDDKKIEISARPLTSSGSNSEPAFSADGGKILFVSRSRASHKQGQVYELDLVRMTERRLTFHDGEDGSPSWWSPTEFLYSSSTDKIKEEPAMIGGLKSAFLNEAKLAVALPSDLYRQRVDGREIKRLTRSPGLDHHATKDPHRQRLVFVRFEDKSRLSLLEGENVKTISPKDVNDFQPKFSPDGKSLVFIRGLEEKRTQIMIAKGIDIKSAKAMTDGKSWAREPSWNPSGDAVIFSSNSSGKVFDLYVLDLKQDCVKRITASNTDLSEPTFSPDGEKIAFTTEVSGKQHLYMMDYSPGQGSCLRSTD
jgi:Tol biopolymer transport system component